MSGPERKGLRLERPIKENCPEASNPGNHNSHRNQLTNEPTTHKAKSRFASWTGANKKQCDNGYCD
jgi:hypothetical protein